MAGKLLRHSSEASDPLSDLPPPAQEQTWAPTSLPAKLPGARVLEDEWSHCAMIYSGALPRSLLITPFRVFHASSEQPGLWGSAACGRGS